MVLGDNQPHIGVLGRARPCVGVLGKSQFHVGVLGSNSPESPASPLSWHGTGVGTAAASCLC